ncbi:MAG: TMEM175 family protein [Microbacterium sp.]
MSDSASSGHRLMAGERLKAFTDAVVAIAMTLLILPLLDSIQDAASRGLDSGSWLVGEGPQLFSFALSFVLIANFWINHHRLFDRVENVTIALLWLTVAWMLTIVWLPVATALLGQMTDDPVQKLLYIGSLLATSLVAVGTRVYLRRHPELHAIPTETQRNGMVAAVTMSVLFALALVIAIALPAVGYWAMFLLLLTGPIDAVVARRLGIRA